MMASIEEAQTSIQQYELQVSLINFPPENLVRMPTCSSLDWLMIFLQLSQVNQALQVCTNDIERASLENLKCDLEEILNLTRETLNELKKPSNVGGADDANADEDDDDDPYAQEMAIFLAEINDCEGGSGSTSKAAAATAGNSNNNDAVRASPSTAEELEKFKVIQRFCDFF